MNEFELYTSYGKSLGEFESWDFSPELSPCGEYAVQRISEEGADIVKVVRDPHTDYYYDKDGELVSYNDD
jgi:hypothetical protein